MADNTDFWGRAVPGMLDLGFGLYSSNAAQKEAEERLKRARGPLYDQSMNAAGGVMAQAGMFDPQAHAAERFASQQALLKPVQDKQLNDLMRMLYAKGQLGMGTYNAGLEGGQTDAGMLMNPKMAAFFAAQNAQRSKDAYAALGEGQSYLDKLLSRSAGLQKQAADTQRSGLEAARTQSSKATANANLVKGVAGLLKDTNAFGKGGMFGGAVDWVRKMFEPSYDTGYSGEWIYPDWSSAGDAGYSGDWTYDDYGEWS